MVSIVIPVYNVEKYIRKCLDSVIGQSYQKIEIILVDDGSEDLSGQICLEYARKDARIIYYEQDNQGLGMARNMGIKLAGGDYITFVDSDDWIADDYIENLLKTIQGDVDISCCALSVFDDSIGKIKAIISFELYNGNSGLNIYMPHMCARLFRKELFLEHNIQMPSLPYEDLATYPILVCLGKKIRYSNYPGYIYRTNRKGSIMYSADNNLKFAQSAEWLIKELKLRKLWLNNKYWIYKLLIYHMSFCLRRLVKSGSDLYDQVKKVLHQCLDEQFPEYTEHTHRKYWVWGSYNLSRMVNFISMDYEIETCQSAHFEFSGIISAMSERVDEKWEHTNAFRNEMLRRDLDKKFIHTEMCSTDWLVLDLLEERYPVIEYKNSYLTESETLLQCTETLEGKRLTLFDADIFELWKEKCSFFIHKIRQSISENQIILVKNYLNETYRQQNELVYFDNAEDIKAMNKRLKACYSYFMELCPGCKVIDVPGSCSDVLFEYGCVPWYGNKSYYYEGAEQIWKIWKL